MSGDKSTMLIQDRKNPDQALIIIAEPEVTRVIRGFDGTNLSKVVLAAADEQRDSLFYPRSEEMREISSLSRTSEGEEK